MKRLLSFLSIILALSLMVSPSAAAYSYGQYSHYGSAYQYGGIWMGQTDYRMHYLPPGSRYGYHPQIPIYSLAPRYEVTYRPYGYNTVRFNNLHYNTRWW